MTKIIRIGINLDRIQIDWDNDRHQAAMILEPYGPEQVRMALMELAMLIERDIHNQKI